MFRLPALSFRACRDLFGVADLSPSPPYPVLQVIWAYPDGLPSPGLWASTVQSTPRTRLSSKSTAKVHLILCTQSQEGHPVLVAPSRQFDPQERSLDTTNPYDGGIWRTATPKSAGAHEDGSTAHLDGRKKPDTLSPHPSKGLPQLLQVVKVGP